MHGIYHIVIIITFVDLTMIIFIQEHRKNCERHGKYIEAETDKNRLEELNDENRRRVNLLHQYIFQPIYWSVYEQEAWRSKQIKKRIELEEKHMLDFQKLNKDQDKKMNGTLKSWWTLARNKDYAEAHKIKVKADTLESFEYDKWEGLRQQEALQAFQDQETI